MKCCYCDLLLCIHELDRCGCGVMTGVSVCAVSVCVCVCEPCPNDFSFRAFLWHAVLIQKNPIKIVLL